MESDNGSELFQALRQEIEPDSHIFYRLVRNHANSDISLNEALWSILEKGFLNSMRILLEAGASPNSRLEEYKTPLHKCSGLKHRTEMVRELLKYGADVNAEDEENRTPLHDAASSQCVENMQELLKHGAAVDAVDVHGRTPLIALLRKSPHVSMVQVLLNAGADVNIRDANGWVALHFVVGKEPPEIVQLLRQHNADATVKTNDDGDTVMHFAAECCMEEYAYETIRELLKCGGRLNELNSNGYPPLIAAIRRLNKDSTQGFLRWGAAFEFVKCLETLVVFYPFAFHESTVIAQELIRYMFINNSDSFGRIRQQLMQATIVSYLCKLSTPECNLEEFKHACLSEVEALSKSSCDCGKSSIWGSINNSEFCSCDTDQAILKFLFSRGFSNFSEALLYKLSEEFALQMTLNLISYFAFKESEKRLILPWPCMKTVERYGSFEDVVSFMLDKHSKMSSFELQQFLVFIEKESPDVPTSEISPPVPKRLRVS